MPPLLEVTGLTVDFPVRRSGFLGRGQGRRAAVSAVDLTLHRGQSLGLVGESGSGKSTLARAIAQLIRPMAGSVRFEGQELTTLSAARLRPIRRHLQMVFQDPYASLNPRMQVRHIVAEPLRVHRVWRTANGPDRVAELLDLVGLSATQGRRYPHELSGGQRQRVGIARALALSPRMLVLDEPVSALDVSVQAGILNLLADLRELLGLSYLLIAHDLSVVRHVCDHVSVMSAGRLVETGSREAVFAAPAHPCTQALLASAPVADPRADRGLSLSGIAGIPATAPPPVPDVGCCFRLRCPHPLARCAESTPDLLWRGTATRVACHAVGQGGQPSAIAYGELRGGGR